MTGDESEALLILASLNLDKILDDRALKSYLNAYLHEADLNYPDERASALTCLKIQLWNLVHCEDARKAENTVLQQLFWTLLPGSLPEPVVI